MARPAVQAPDGAVPVGAGAQTEEAGHVSSEPAVASSSPRHAGGVPAPRQAAATPRTGSRTAGFYLRAVKPIYDRVGAAIGLVLLSPVLMLLALAVLVSLGRPILFTQERVGLHGRPLHVVKFRTMRPDRRVRQQSFSEIERRRTHKSDNDPRHTRVGRIFRKLSLDELPQLVNVLRGEMSLVGPRPELPAVVDRYQPWEHRRHEVRPGLTGLWQITARGEGMMHERVDLDVRYVDTLSARTDAGILLRTLPAALGRRAGS
jgi:lipopolysaccharide/colanic/teichoic acid biosynthesis glycosyltransferase